VTDAAGGRDDAGAPAEHARREDSRSRAHDTGSSSADARALAAIAARYPALRLLVLFGSRARGDAHEHSDWDLGYLADAAGGFDPDALLLALVTELGTDRVDLVDLARAGALVRMRAASEGRPLHERRPGVFADFRQEAVRFWCDIEPLLRAGYANVLARLGGGQRPAPVRPPDR
jgi:predicted nucleotidyltransferase